MCHFLGSRWGCEGLISCCGVVLDLQCQVDGCGKLSQPHFMMSGQQNTALMTFLLMGDHFRLLGL